MYTQRLEHIHVTSVVGDKIDWDCYDFDSDNNEWVCWGIRAANQDRESVQGEVIENGWYYKDDPDQPYVYCGNDLDHSPFGEKCFAKGTKILMSDNSYKNIEDIKVGDTVMSLNHQTGKQEPKQVYLIYKGENTDKSFTLKFTNNINLSICGKHDLFEKDSRKYVTIINDNAKEFIGKHFYNAVANRYEELLEVVYNDEQVDYYSIYIKNNLNCIAEDMLSLPDDVDEYLNVYSFKEDLTIDQQQLKKDIEKYGLLEYKENDLYSKQMYEDFNVKYYNIIIGKGISTRDRMVSKIYR